MTEPTKSEETLGERIKERIKAAVEEARDGLEALFNPPVFQPIPVRERYPSPRRRR